MKVKEYENKLNDILKLVNSTTNEIDRLGFTQIEVVDLTKKIILSSDDEKAYQSIGQAFNFVILQINSLIRVSHGLNLVDFETMTAVPLIAPITLKVLDVAKIDTQLANKLQAMNSTLITIENVFVNYQFLAKENLIPDTVPSPSKPTPMPETVLKPLTEPVISNGYTKISNLPGPTFSSMQGAGFDNDYYYVFGRQTSSDPKLSLQVIAKNQRHSSFFATGNIGTMVRAGKSGPNVDYVTNQLGHANDCIVLSKKGNEVTLLVASMEPNKVATCIVDVVKQTVHFGKRISLKQFKKVVNEDLSMMSLQKLDNGQILFKGNARYWTATYNEQGMTLSVFARMQKATALGVAQKYLGTNFMSTNTVGQADWYANGCLYAVLCDSDTYSRSIVVELIPQGTDKLAIPSNRLWYIQGTSYAELEKVWFENGQMMGNIGIGNPTDHFIAQLNWKK